ncbi:MAG: tRNA-uridine aminocarboxypropyltransferase [Polaromonas sp.]|uniref:tRNA-uridine aminocarboxypropyltransferase n=1 Tax=Polaromonas sp. TaxID=1869339 RepID=UPI00272F1621|nr:tRNA-uridine aminocarboxypropyltransferase [Polaromonas sp.]MDP2255108.1 tRNA-uridine aminocarboxypropyltransferase [Polaromonas sp.]MDP3709968.1 tRNA-uridine aminocarboxypropyltransferase [Polaromonas sp.]
MCRGDKLNRIQRLSCAVCLRPQSACICQWITPVDHRVEVVVLQHPLEVGQAKGSARLLHLSLPHSALVTGEVFAEAALRALISAPLHQHASASPPMHTILLYPDSPQDQALGLPAPPALAPAHLHDPSRLRLIVLDGTWRKSRKMLYLNPLLHQLPRLALRGMPASHYRIRKAHQPDQLSTLEATCAALVQLEGNAESFKPLLAAFDGFVAQQAGYRT